MQEDSLFVTGSMSQGMVHYNRISEFITAQKPAEAKGSVYRLEVGYPVFVNDGSSSVAGHFVQFSKHEILFKLLDEFHGYSLRNPEKSLYLRNEIEVTVENQNIKTQVYSIHPNKIPRTATPISDGNWKKAIAERAPLTESLTKNQRTYVQKLGRSTGRDIVPINLDLYRELMNKGLIVDKGRRLALTALGQEVFHFLE